MAKFLEGEGLIFLVGCSRSGTTYLQKLIAAHPLVNTGQESHLFGLIGTIVDYLDSSFDFFELNPRYGAGLLCYFEKEQIYELIEEFATMIVDGMTSHLNKPSFFLEKTPKHVLRMPLIHQIFPRAKFIHIIRDARDTTASMLAASRSWGRLWMPKTAREAALKWNHFVYTGRISGRTLGNVLYIEVKYEDLIDDPKRELLRLGSFIGIEWTTSDLENSIMMNNSTQARVEGGTPIELRGMAARINQSAALIPDGAIRRANKGYWKKDLNPYQKLVVWYLCKGIMKDAGYLWKYPWTD